MHPTIRVIATLALVLATTTGCNHFNGGDNPGDARGSVAIIDLDAAARQLGYDTQMAGALRQQKASLEKQLGVIQTSPSASLIERFPPDVVVIPR